MHMVSRYRYIFWRFFAVTISLLIALAIASVFVIVAGSNPLLAFYSIFEGSLSNWESFSETLVKATPLIFTSVACAVAFKSNMFNIGAEGQMYIGQAVTAVAALTMPINLPSYLFIPYLMVVSFIGGAIWAAIPGYLKLRFGISEVVTTMLMNYIPIYLVDYIVFGPFYEKARRHPQTDPIPEAARLLKIHHPYRAHIGIFIAIAVSVAVYVFLWKTSKGFEFRATGASTTGARSMGINVNRRLMQAMIISGGIAGLAGFSIVSGTYHKLKLGTTGILGHGFAGILAALVANNHPLGAAASGFIFSVLMVGSETMQRAAGVPFPIVSIVEALLVLAVLLSGRMFGFLSRKVRI